MSSYTYDPSTRTLAITGPAGYHEAISANLPLDDILILKDKSQPHTNDKAKIEPIADVSTIRTDQAFQLYTPPADFPLLPSLDTAHFSGALLQPPPFPLPPTCNLNVSIRARLRQEWPIADNENISHYHPVDPLDTIYPWFQLPLKTLTLTNFATSTSAPPACDTLEHLFLQDSNTFHLPAGSHLPRNLKTFVLEYSNHDSNSADDSFDPVGLIAALPCTLETLVLNTKWYESFPGAGLSPRISSLAHFTGLKTLCVWRVLLDEDAALFSMLPEGLETLVLHLKDHDPDELEEMVEEIKDYCEVAGSLRRLVVFRERYGQDDEEGDEVIRRVCEEQGIELMLQAGDENMVYGIDVVCPEEVEGELEPRVVMEKTLEAPGLRMCLRFGNKSDVGEEER